MALPSVPNTFIDRAARAFLNAVREALESLLVRVTAIEKTQATATASTAGGATLAAQGTVFAGPVGGGNGQATFRRLRISDLPDITADDIGAVPSPDPSSLAEGDLLYVDAALEFVRLPRGADGQALLSNAASIGWGDILQLPAGVAAGDIAYFDGAVWAILPRGTIGQVLTATATSVEWATLPP